MWKRMVLATALLFSNTAIVLADVESAKNELLAAPKIKFVDYISGDLVYWNVGVHDDGNLRYGYAMWVCQILIDHNVRTPTTIVRIVDVTKYDRKKKFSAHLGGADCEDFSRF